MLGLIVWILFGALTGWIVSLVQPYVSAEKTRLNILIGIIGALIGGIIAQFAKGETLTHLSDLSISGAIICSLILIGSAYTLIHNHK